MTSSRSGRGDPWSVDYRTAAPEEILERADELTGLTLGEVAVRPANPVHSTAETKGSVGAIYERYFGIPSNNLQEPDFTSSGIELKSVPVVERRNGPAVKERTFVTLIDYMSLPDEAWATASVKKKLSSILLVYYEWRQDTDLYDFVTRRVHLWNPSALEMGSFEGDWTVVRDKVREGYAELVSEADGRLLGAATKSSDGSVRVPQPYSTVGAKPRAWALKATLTRSILADAESDLPVESLVASSEDATLRALEDDVLRRLRPYVGARLGALADRLGLGPSSGKAKGARIIRRALGLQEHSRILEFERMGVEVKTVRMSPAGLPYEAMSFPAFRYRDLVEYEWGDSDLSRSLNRLLIVPIVGAERTTPFEDCVLAEPFFWSPSPADAEGIEREWTMFRDEIAAGHAARLTPESQTRYIHVRPKARDGSDTDDAPVVGPVIKKCFWLNRDYVRRIIADAHA